MRPVYRPLHFALAALAMFTCLPAMGAPPDPVPASSPPVVSDPKVSFNGSLTGWDGGAVKVSGPTEYGPVLRVWCNNLNAPGQAKPRTFPKATVYLFLPPAITVDPASLPPDVSTHRVNGWTEIVLSHPAIAPTDSHMWSIRLVSTAVMPGEVFSFKFLAGTWILGGDTKIVRPTPAAPPSPPPVAAAKSPAPN